MIITKQKRLAIKEVINRNFTFSDLSPRFEGVDSSTGNIFCPFHENHHSPAAKMYWDSDRELWIIHCFGECHRNFTAYDYVDLILCNKYQKYSSPLDFLRKNMEAKKLEEQIDYYEVNYVASSQDNYKKKIEYINNVYSETENIIDYMENLYLG